MKTVTVGVFNSVAEAESLKMRLIAAGITAELHNESKSDEKRVFSRGATGVHVRVPRSDFEAALEIVYDWDRRGDAGAPVPGRLEHPPREPAARPAGGGRGSRR